MKRSKIMIMALLAVLLISSSVSVLRPKPALAHPLGNFTVNTLSIIEKRGLSSSARAKIFTAMMR